MSKFKRVLKIILGILVISVFLVGIPIVINECYKANCGYSTAWDASAMLGYYGTILGAIMLVKRPLLVGDDFVLVGFKDPEWSITLSK